MKFEIDKVKFAVSFAVVLIFNIIFFLTFRGMITESMSQPFFSYYFLNTYNMNQIISFGNLFLFVVEFAIVALIYTIIQKIIQKLK